LSLLNLKVNENFAPLWETDKRYVVMKGSAGSGKSVDSAEYYITKTLSKKGINVLCVRKIADSHISSTYNELVKVITSNNLDKYFKCTTNPLLIRCLENDNVIMFAGCYDEKQIQKLKSITAPKGKITDVWIEEATELQRSDLDIIDDRLRGVLPKGMFYQIRMTFNPISATHWLKKDFFDVPNKNVITHHSTYLQNAFIDEAYKERMMRRKESDPDGYQIYGLGEWGETTSLILHNWEVKEFEFKYDYRKYGQDFGFNHANAILDIGIKDGNIYIWNECYVNERTSNEIMELIADWDKSVGMFCDSAEPDRINMFFMKGWKAEGVKKYSGMVKADIAWLKQRKIFIHPRCVNTINEIQQWRWAKNKNGEYTDEPAPFNDDAMSALRYGCHEWIKYNEVAIQQQEKKNKINFACEEDFYNEGVYNPI
jgi:phage terminase large subunit